MADAATGHQRVTTGAEKLQEEAVISEEPAPTNLEKARNETETRGVPAKAYQQ